MARSRLRPENKRFYLSLHQRTFERLNELLADMGAPRSTASLMIDEYVKGTVALFEHLKQVKNEQGREPTFTDAMGAIGKMMEGAKTDD